MLKQLLSMLVLAALLAGCNTIAGAGKDLQQGGKSLESAAQHAQKNM